MTDQIQSKKGKEEMSEVSFGLFDDLWHLDRARDVETLLHARDVELEHPHIFALDGNRPWGSS